MRIGAIVQAREFSTRLPKKVLKDLPYGSGITALEQIIKRLKRSEKLDNIVVATTLKKQDGLIVDIAEKEKVKCFRGSEKNVLLRYYLAAKENSLDIIVRVTGDCPCISSEIVDFILEKHIETKSDYTSNTLKKTYPCGLDVDVFNFNTLEEAYKNAQKDYEKEHVVPYIYRNYQVFKITPVEAPRELHAPDIRITLDTEEDYALLCVVFDYLYQKNEYFNPYDIVNLFREKPWLKLINKKVIQKERFDTLDDELKEAIKILDLQELRRAKKFLEGQIPI